MAGTNTPVIISDSFCEAAERPHAIGIRKACKKLAIAVSTAIALHTSPVLAQTAPTAPSASAIPSADKGG